MTGSSSSGLILRHSISPKQIFFCFPNALCRDGSSHYVTTWPDKHTVCISGLLGKNMRESTFLTVMKLSVIFFSPCKYKMNGWDNSWVWGYFIRMNRTVNSTVEQQEVCSVQYIRPLLHPSRANNKKRSRVWLKKEETEAILIRVGGHSTGQSRGINASWLVCLLCLSVCKTFPCSSLQTAGWIRPGNWVNHK